MQQQYLVNGALVPVKLLKLQLSPSPAGVFRGLGFGM